MHVFRAAVIAAAIAFAPAAYAEEKPDPSRCPAIAVASGQIQEAATPEGAVEAFQAFAKAFEPSLVMDDAGVQEAVADIKTDGLDVWRKEIWNAITDEMTFHGCTVSPKRT